MLGKPTHFWSKLSKLVFLCGLVCVLLVPQQSRASGFGLDSFVCTYLRTVADFFGMCPAAFTTLPQIETLTVSTPAVGDATFIVPSRVEPESLVVGATTTTAYPSASTVVTSAPVALSSYSSLDHLIYQNELQSQIASSTVSYLAALTNLFLLQRDRGADNVSKRLQSVQSTVTDLQTGSRHFTTLSVDGVLKDSLSSAGTSGQILVSTGTGVSWVATSSLGISPGSLGAVSSVGLSAPAGFVVSGSPVTATGTLSFTYASGYEALLTASSSNWNSFYNTPNARITAGSGLGWTGNTLTLDTTGNWSGTFGGQTGAYYLDRANHTGTQSTSTITGVFGLAQGGTGATSSASARTNLGATTVGASLFTLGDPGTTSFLRINADNSVSALDAGSFLAAIGAGAGSGTVSSVGLTAPTGFTVSGSPVTSAGTLALSYAAGYGPVLTASSTIWNNFYNTPSGRIGAGTGLVWSGNTLSINTAGDWTGTFDGLEGLAYLDRANHTGTQATSTIAGVFGTVHGGTGLSSIVQNQLLIGGAGNTWSQMATSSLGLSAAFTNSAELAALLSDEVGTGNAVFSDSPSFTGNVGIGTSTPGASLTVAGNQITTGYLSVGSTAPVNTTAGDFTANRVFIGNTTPLTTNVTPGFQVVGNSAATSQILSARFSNDVNPPGFQSAKARGTAASPSELLVGDSLYSLSGYGYVSSGVFAQGSTIIATVDKTPTTTAIPTALLFATASSTIPLERMRISSNGNVGIGSSTPSASLAVVSSGSTVIPLILSVNGGTTFAQFYNAAGTLRAQIGDGSFSAGTGSLTNVAFGSLSDNNNGIYFPAADNTAIVTSGVERFRVDSSGNVGVGTSTPATKLDVNGSVQLEGTSSLLTINPYGAISDTNAISFTANRGNVGYDGSYSSLVLQSGASKDIRFVTNNTGSLSGANPVMIIGGGNSATAGYIGIGTTTPSYPLDVNGSVAFGASINSGNGSNVGDVNLELGSLRTASGNAYVDLHSTAGSDFDFRIIRSAGLNGNALLSNAGTGTFSLSANGVSRLTIDGSSGNVGIGTTTPATKLEVFASGEAMRIGDDTNANTYLGMAQITGNGPRAFFGYNATAYGSDSGYAVIQGGPSKGIGFSVGNGYTFGGAPSLYITGSSSVGIGTTSPSGKLTVASTSRSSYAVNMLDTDGSNSGGLYLSVSGAGVVLLNDDTGATKVQIHGNGSSVLNGGNLGIGTSSPAAKLDLYGTAGSADIFAISSSSNSRILTVSANGNVGIGTSTPTNSLTLPAGLQSTPALSLGDSNTGLYRNTINQIAITASGTVSAAFSETGIGVDTVYNIVNGNNSQLNFNVNGGIFKRNVSDANAAFTIYQQHAGSTGDILRLKNSVGVQVAVTQAGSVGIGTTSPSSKLHVVGINDVTGGITISSTVGTESDRFAIYPDANFSTAFKKLSSSGTVTFRNSVGTPEFVIGPTSLIGIGTSTPLAKLDITGTAGSADIFAISSSSNARLLTVAANGNVGIGSSTPTAVLSVDGSLASSVTLKVKGTTGQDIFQSIKSDGTIQTSISEFGDVYHWPRMFNSFIDLYHNVTLINTSTLGWSSTTSPTVSQDTAFSRLSAAKVALGNGTSGDFSGTLIASGISIGTSSPVASLDIVGPFIGNYGEMILGSLNNAGGIGFRDGNGIQNGMIGYNGASASTQFKINNSANNGMVTLSTANNSASGGITFMTANTERGRFAYNGNFGIGTTTPAALLDVFGTSTSADLFAVSSSTGARLLTVAANGNVGIGTTTPSTKFDIYSGSSGMNPIFGTTILSESNSNNYLSLLAAGASQSGIFFGNNGNNIDVGIVANVSGTRNMQLRTGGNITAMTIDAGGNIGIGTTSPTNKLEVVGNGYFSGSITATGTLTILGTTTIGGTDSRGVLTVQRSVSPLFVSNTDPSDVGRYFVMENTSATNQANQYANVTLQVNPTGLIGSGRVLGDLRLVREATSSTDSFFLLSAFRQDGTYKDFAKVGYDSSYFVSSLGIGTTTPAAKLDVYGAAGSADIFAISSSSNARLFTVAANGNVGIGTTTPSNMLQVAGGIASGIPSSLQGNMTIHGGAGQPSLVVNGPSSGIAQISINSGANRTLELVNPNAIFDLGLTVEGGVLASSTLTVMGASTLATTTISNLMLSQALAGTSGGTGLSTITPNQLLIGGAGNTWIQLATSSLGIALSDTIGMLPLSRLPDFGGVNTVLYTTALNTFATTSAFTFDGATLLAPALTVSGATGLGTTTLSGALTIGTTAVFEQNGNVGIGTTTPSVQFQLLANNNFTTTAIHLIQQSGSGDAATRYSLTGGNAFTIGVDNSDSDSFKMSYSSTSATGMGTGDYFTLTTAGNFGLGTSSPSAQLNVYASNTNTNTAMVSIQQAGSGDSSLRFNLVNGVAYTMGIDNTDSDSFKISYNATNGVSMGTGDYFTVTNAGNVGIGTTSPGALLSVAGTTLITGTTTMATTSMNGALMMGLQYIGNDGGVEGLQFDTSGRAKLLSTSGAVTAGLTLSNGSAAVGSGASLEFETGGTLTQGRISTTIEGASSASNMAFYTRGGAVTSERMRISSNGNVGIGTTSSSSLLTVAGTLTVTSTSTFAGNVGVGTTTPAAQLSIMAAPGIDALVVSSSTANKKMFVVDSVGRVGIGTDAPSFDLEVVNPSANATFIIDSKAASDAVFRFREGGSSRFVLGNDGGSDSFRIATGTTLANGSNVAFTVVQSGNIGIGTTTPTAQLTTAGSVRFANFGAGTLSTDADGNLSVSSDERLKDSRSV
jgi:hypothetical protein